MLHFTKKISLKQSIKTRQNQNIAAELVYLLYSQANPAIIGSLIVATCLFYAFYHVVPRDALDSWYILMLGLTVFRYVAVKIYLAKQDIQKKSRLWGRFFILMAASAGFSWSLAGTLIVSSSSMHQTFIAFALAGVSAGAIPYYSGSRIACAAFIIPILLPFAIWLLTQNNTPDSTLGILTLFYLGLLLVSSFRTHKAIYNAVKLKFENQELVSDLSSAKKEMELINHELQIEINERKIAEKLLKESEDQYRLVTDALPVLIAYIDKTLHFRYNNKAYEEWFAKSRSEIMGKHLKELIGNTAFAIFFENYQKLSVSKQVSYETILQFRNEEERYISVTLIPHVQDGEMDGFFSLMSDMTPRMNYLATHDALTDLPNRSLFNARFSHALKRAEREKTTLALLFLDLDHFKNINDTLGHDVGDRLLVKVAERIKSCLSDEEILARLGGDEFTIILEKTNHTQMAFTARKVCDAFALPFHLDNRDIFITTSIGISTYPNDGNDMQMLLKNADMAIYRAKEQGRNTFDFFTSEMNEKMLRKHAIETNLRSALERRELLIHYQPVVNVLTGRMNSVEALLRWNHPKLGMISPVEFIPVAEESGLIVPISKWVLRNACLQSLAWQQTGAKDKIKLAINLSPRQFRESRLVDDVTSILQEIGLNGDHLVFELTESMIMHDIEYSAKVIKSLKELGIAISIDDFGTGYSSLNYLRRFPIDNIKIDRSFITELTNNADDAAIVTAIIAMAHSLKMKVIAEGVETLEQYSFLRERNCDEIQGYLISPAISAEQINPLLQKSSLLETGYSQCSRDALV